MPKDSLKVHWPSVYLISYQANVSHHTTLKAMRGERIAGPPGDRLAAVYASHGLRVPWEAEVPAQKESAA